MTVGIELAVSIAIGFGIGSWMDERFGTAPWLLVLWVLVGVSAGFRSMYRAAKLAMRTRPDQGK